MQHFVRTGMGTAIGQLRSIPCPTDLILADQWPIMDSRRYSNVLRKSESRQRYSQAPFNNKALQGWKSLHRSLSSDKDTKLVSGSFLTSALKRSRPAWSAPIETPLCWLFSNTDHFPPWEPQMNSDWQWAPSIFLLFSQHIGWFGSEKMLNRYDVHCVNHVY